MRQTGVASLQYVVCVNEIITIDGRVHDHGETMAFNMSAKFHTELHAYAYSSLTISFIVDTL